MNLIYVLRIYSNVKWNLQFGFNQLKLYGEWFVGVAEDNGMKPIGAHKVWGRLYGTS